MKKAKQTLSKLIILVLVLIILVGIHYRSVKIKTILKKPDLRVILDIPRDVIEPHVVPFYPKFDDTPINANGTGFHMEYKGRIVLMTNSHICTASESKEYVKFGRKVHKIIAIDIVHDLCVLESDRKTGLKLAKEDVSRMDKVILVGYPRGIGPVVREGRVIRMEFVHTPWLEGRLFPLPSYRISTPAIGGNSGSPVTNQKGEVVGVLYAGNPYYPLEGLMVPLAFIEVFLEREL